jgi:hypothetical protein
MAKPLDKELYEQIKLMANKVFNNNKGIYRSAWISKTYVANGGLYDKPKPKKTKFDIWRSESWVDLNNPIKQGNKIIGYNKCGSPNTQNNLYPLCRPSKVIDKNTPQTYQTINKQKIAKVNKQKQILQKSGNILF